MLLKETGVTDPAQLEPVYERIAPIDPFDRRAHAALGQSAMAAERFDDASQRVPGRGRAEAGRPGGGSHRPGRELLRRRASGPKRSGRRSPRWRSRPSYERAQDLLLKI